MRPAAAAGGAARAGTARLVGALPAGLTSDAREAFRDAVEEFRDGLYAELRRRRRSRPDLTRNDVDDARTIVAQAMYRSSSPGRSSPSLLTLGPGLVVIGSVGVASMHPYLHSPWQIAVLVVCGLTGLTGVGLAWRSGRRVDASADTVG